MVALSLQRNTPEQKKETTHIIEDLKNTFGEDNVNISFKCEHWVYVDIVKVSGWVQGNVPSLNHVAKLHLFDIETQRKNYDIPFEIIDTIYNL